MKYNLSAAVIGTGYMGEKHIEVLSKLVDRLIICSNDEEGRLVAESFGCKFKKDYKQLFETEKIDFASICLPTHLHYEATLCALSNGINVICEKPFASNEDEARAMISAAKENNLLLMIAHPLRFSKLHTYLKKCIDDNRFGKLISLRLNRHAEAPSWSVGNWLKNPSLSGGVTRDLHIHDTDYMVSVLGAPEKLYTIGDDNYCETIFTYPNGTHVNASASWRNAKDVPFDNHIDANFEKATIKIAEGELSVYTTEDFTPIEKEDFGEFIGQGDSIKLELDYFCHCLKNNLSTTISPPEECCLSLKITALEAKSMDEQKEIKVI